MNIFPRHLEVHASSDPNIINVTDEVTRQILGNVYYALSSLTFIICIWIRYVNSENIIPEFWQFTINNSLI